MHNTEGFDPTNLGWVGIQCGMGLICFRVPQASHLITESFVRRLLDSGLLKPVYLRVETSSATSMGSMTR